MELPSREDAELAALSSRILARAPEGDILRVRLDDGQELALPKAATRLLSHILAEMAHGNAVTIMPIHAELTTQEAADYLNVSRPFLIRMLERGEIKFHMVGTHRRIRFEDLRDYKNAKAAESERHMDELAKQAQDLDLGY